jgi:hypothetical protein
MSHGFACSSSTVGFSHPACRAATIVDAPSYGVLQVASVASVVRNEGPSALYSGLSPAVARGVTYGGDSHFDFSISESGLVCFELDNSPHRSSMHITV